MAREVRQIRIESILGGHSQTTHFAGEGQFRFSLGIDPARPIDTGQSDVGTYFSGLLRPIGSTNLGSSSLTDPVMWMKDSAKDSRLYLYDAKGSMMYFTKTYGVPVVTGISDGGNEAGSGSGNGLEYYDNYMYFAKDTTIARYGPLNGTPALDGDYWGTTLGKAALTNTTYHQSDLSEQAYPNHVLHRHSDGRLYIADVVDNQGTIHFIETTKSTVEGDTDSGSTYDALTVGRGLYPVAMESYGESLAIAFVEKQSGAHNSTFRSTLNAKIAFWDTTSEDVNQITWAEFPDPVISALKNINGVLYVMSGPMNNFGFRISRYVGGNTFQEVFMSEDSFAPFPGAVVSLQNSLVFGGFTFLVAPNPCVFSLGLRKQVTPESLFCIATSTGRSDAEVTALAVDNTSQFYSPRIYHAWASDEASGTANHGIDYTEDGANSAGVPSIWWSETFRIGQPFKITKVRIPLASPVGANTSIKVYVYIDDDHGQVAGYTQIGTINNTNYPNQQSVVFEPQNLSGDNNFWLYLRWEGTSVDTVSLPITIDYELMDIHSVYASP